MNWQDIVFTIGQLIFVIALIPSIRSKDKPAFISSAITAVILVGFGITYTSLGLWGSAIFAFLNATAWAILAFQKYLIDKKSK